MCCRSVFLLKSHKEKKMSPPGKLTASKEHPVVHHQPRHPPDRTTVVAGRNLAEVAGRTLVVAAAVVGRKSLEEEEEELRSHHLLHRHHHHHRLRLEKRRAGIFSVIHKHGYENEPRGGKKKESAQKVQFFGRSSLFPFFRRVMTSGFSDIGSSPPPIL